MIKLIKLVNDHEVIGELVEEGKQQVVLRDPFSIHYMVSSSSDKPIIGLLRYMPFADSREISFNFRDIINYLDARESMVVYYKSVLDNHNKYIDSNIDKELFSVAEEEAQIQKEEDARSELMTALLQRISTNKMH